MMSLTRRKFEEWAKSDMCSCWDAWAAGWESGIYHCCEGGYGCWHSMDEEVPDYIEWVIIWTEPGHLATVKRTDLFKWTNAKGWSPLPTIPREDVAARDRIAELESALRQIKNHVDYDHLNCIRMDQAIAALRNISNEVGWVLEDE